MALAQPMHIAPLGKMLKNENLLNPDSGFFSQAQKRRMNCAELRTKQVLHQSFTRINFR